MSEHAILKETKRLMHKSVEALSEEFRAIRTGQANPALVEHLKVLYYGTPTPLKQLANITIPEARMIVIKPYDAGVLGDIEKALLTAELGLTPNSDGKVIRLTVPPLSEENRKQLATKAKEVAEHIRISLRNERRDANRKVDKELKNKTLSEDLSHDLKNAVQEEIKKAEKHIDDAVDHKTKEILEI